jgi:hypothetical protein
VDFEIALLDYRVWPNARHQLALGDQLTRSLRQRNKDFQGAAADTNGVLPLQQELLCREEAERAK